MAASTNVGDGSALVDLAPARRVGHPSGRGVAVRRGPVPRARRGRRRRDGAAHGGASPPRSTTSRRRPRRCATSSRSSCRCSPSPWQRSAGDGGPVAASVEAIRRRGRGHRRERHDRRVPVTKARRRRGGQAGPHHERDARTHRDGGGPATAVRGRCLPRAAHATDADADRARGRPRRRCRSRSEATEASVLAEVEGLNASSSTCSTRPLPMPRRDALSAAGRPRPARGRGRR